MITTTGTVTDITVEHEVSSGFGKFTLIEASTNRNESFSLWSYSPGDPPLPFTQWITQSLMVSLLKEALINKLPVGVLHDVTSATVVAVTLNAA